MSSLNLLIPAEVVDSLRLPPGRAEEELHREFAVFLVKERLLTRAQARRVAVMERLEFENLLALREVPWEVSSEEALDDLAAALRPSGSRSLPEVEPSTPLRGLEPCANPTLNNTRLAICSDEEARNAQEAITLGR